MYAQHFGLEHEPFSIAPDPRYLYLSERHREALAHLLYGLGGGGGFVLLTGEIGAGKTTVCRCFLEQVPAHCQVAYIFNPKLTVVELLAAVCDEFGISLPRAARATRRTARRPASTPSVPTVKDYIDPLNNFLLEAHAAGRNCVLVIDEAQQLSPEVLEQLRLLTNLETSERKLLQIILVGQPELRDMLAQPGLEQLAQRVIARYHLGPLSTAETGLYLQHRLAVAGLRNASPLGPALVRLIHRLSGGVPRRINLLCDRALLGAYSQGRADVDRKTLSRAAQEIDGERLPPSRFAGWRSSGTTGSGGPWRYAGLGLAALGILALGAWATGWRAGEGGSERAASLATAASAVTKRVGASAASASTSASALAVVSASTAASSASAADTLGAARHATPLKPDELRRLLRGRGVDEAGAWRALAARWGLAADPTGDPCSAAANNPLNCFKSPGGLALARQLDRPGLLALRDGDGPPVYVLLVAADAQLAWLQIGPDVWPVTQTELAGWWRGDFGTLWRSPPTSAADRPGRGGAGTAWLTEHLTGVGIPAMPLSAASPERALQARLVSFQVAKGLDPDGQPGPLTMMALNRAAGVAEPHLTTTQP